MAQLGMNVSEITTDNNGFEVGTVIRCSDGYNYIITKKTTTAIAIQRYYWWDRIIAWYKTNIRGLRGRQRSEPNVNKFAT